MAQGTITNVIPTSGGSNPYYCKLPDGTMLVWGNSSFAAHAIGDQDVTVNFGQTFSSAPRVVVSWADSAAVNDYMSLLSATAMTTTSFSGRTRRKNANYAWAFHWIAIGRWK